MLREAEVTADQRHRVRPRAARGRGNSAALSRRVTVEMKTRDAESRLLCPSRHTGKTTRDFVDNA